MQASRLVEALRRSVTSAARVSTHGRSLLLRSAPAVSLHRLLLFSGVRTLHASPARADDAGAANSPVTLGEGSVLGMPPSLDTPTVRVQPATLPKPADLRIGRDLAQLARLIVFNRAAISRLDEIYAEESDPDLTEAQWSERRRKSPGKFQHDIAFEAEEEVRFTLQTDEAERFLERILDRLGLVKTDLLRIEHDLFAFDKLEVNRDAMSHTEVFELFDHKDTMQENLAIMQMGQPDDTRTDGEIFPVDKKGILMATKKKEDAEFCEGRLPNPDGSIPEIAEEELKLRREADIVGEEERERSSKVANVLRGFSSALIGSTITSKVVKGGSIYTYRAIVVIGNGKGVGGFATGRGTELKGAIENAARKARKNLLSLDLYENRTIHHSTKAKNMASLVKLWPLGEGRGIRACRQFIVALDIIGIKDAGVRIVGSTNMMYAIGALFKALASVRSAEQIAVERGLKFVDINEAFRLRSLRNRARNLR
ncbi:30S ribosomal protein S5 [Porphyridium purpureum]|uniref:30S ribosomal protein S5, chloroplastic n=1 Tax=Porphyridium purpureum TaxID=35688 RepID=A0A5J4YMG9_PORPP|nr:30S ribosomal protein S5 [Porphyridium purpureum]KAA8492348.1 30S ribosomal protein S5 [Porphyridium purpureum]|eukprot:POR6688..scf249_10